MTTIEGKDVEVACPRCGSTRLYRRVRVIEDERILEWRDYGDGPEPADTKSDNIVEFDTLAYMCVNNHEFDLSAVA